MITTSARQGNGRAGNISIQELARRQVREFNRKIQRKIATNEELTSDEKFHLKQILGTSKPEQMQTEIAKWSLKPHGNRKRSNGRSSEHDLAVQGRRTMVAKLRLETPPVPVREIASRLRVNPSTICNDIKAIREERQAILTQERAGMLGEAITSYEVIRGLGFRIHEESKRDGEKVRGLGLALHAQDSLVKLGYETGLIPTVAKRTRIPDAIDIPQLAIVVTDDYGPTGRPESGTHVDTIVPRLES